ncbi:MAG TPA: glycosyltransferase family 4 protein, partial [Pararhizobium sp.]|nr:glycosyltransferase family 4 protein [Pararhizobium sp.]
TGRVRHQKGTDLFVDAMIALLPRFPEWNAVITGRVTPEHRGFAAGLQERIRQAGLDDRIRFIGEVDDIRPWYRHMTLFVAPSRNEGFGLTPLEAMASGTAVVASDAGAYAEMIRDGATGAVVPAGDGDALREAIGRYLADPALAKAHGDAGVEHVRANFALEREASALASIYQRLAVS